MLLIADGHSMDFQIKTLIMPQIVQNLYNYVKHLTKESFPTKT
jgi:hypothetical protein